MSLSRLFAREFRPMLRMLEEGPFTRQMYHPLRGNGSFGLRDPFASLDRDITPAVDVVESNDNYVLHAEVPGMKKQDITVRIGDEGRSLIINGRTTFKPNSSTAEAKPPPEADSTANVEAKTPSELENTDSTSVTRDTPEKPVQNNDLYKERTFAGDISFSRTIYLPNPVDTRGVVARLEDGILTVKANKLQNEGNVVDIPVQ